jgi:hypothetical protein
MKTKLPVNTWLISDFLFVGNEIEAEQRRIDKAIWEQRCYNKRLATIEEIETKKLNKILIDDRHITPSVYMQAYFIGIKYHKNDTGYKKGSRYEFRLFQINEKFFMYNNKEDKKLIEYKSFSHFMSYWNTICKLTTPTPFDNLPKFTPRAMCVC